MLRLLIYGIGGFIVAFILAFVWVSLRPTKKQADGNSSSPFLICLAIAWGSPFIYVELLTIARGRLLRSAVVEAVSDVQPGADFKFFKVLSYKKDSALVMAIGELKDDLGTSDRPVVMVRLEKSTQGWSAVHTKVAVSERLGLNEWVMPPYR